MIDRFVARSLRRHQLRLEHFQETPGGGWYLTDDGRRNYLALFDEYRQRTFHEALNQDVPVWSLPVLQTTLMARHVRDDLSSYLPWAA